MSISDPAGILQRVPELQELISDAKIRHAIETGDPFRIYRALMLARLFRRLPEQRQLLKALTSERKLFARPLKGTPGLGTINSVGLSFVGQAEQDEEGYHIALHAFVVLFALPIIPLGAYLVKSTGSRQWQIFARVPLGMAGWLYTRGLAMLLVLSVLGGAAHSWHESGEHDVLMLNGFPRDLIVHLNGQQFIVPANGQATARFKIGPVSGSARLPQAGVVDEFIHELKFGKQTTIWNIAGAAPLVREYITYFKRGDEPKNIQPDGNGYCGQQLLELEGIDYLFTEPPTTISMSKHQSSRVVSHVMMYKDKDQPQLNGIDVCTKYMLGSPDIKNLAAGLEAMAALQNWEMHATELAVFSAQGDSAPRAAKVAKRAAQAKPELAYLRQYRAMAEMAGQHAQLFKEFSALARSQPDNPDYHYLSATILSGEARQIALQAVTKRFPQYPPSLVSLGWHRFVHGDYQGALQDIRHLRQFAPTEANQMLDTEVQALIAIKQSKAALQLLHVNLLEAKNDDPVRYAVDYLLLARQLGQPDPEQWLRHYANDKQYSTGLDVQSARAGLAVTHQSEGDLKNLIAMSQTLRTDPNNAMNMASKLPALAFRYLAPEQNSLLMCEALRTQYTALVRLLRPQIGTKQNAFNNLRAYVRGEAVKLEDEDYEPELQAAAHLSRARQPNIAASEREKLRQMAYQLDFLHGAITTALEKWPQS